MLLMILVFIVLTVALTVVIAAGSSILSTMSKQEKLQAFKLFTKSSLYAAIAVGILSVITFLF